MSTEEIATRAWQELDARVERRRLRRSNPPTRDRLREVVRVDGSGEGWDASLTAAALRRRRLLFAGLERLDRTRQLLTARYPSQVASAIARADEVARRRFDLFGQSCMLSDPPDWHADPITGESWPDGFHRDVPIGDPSTRRGDVKHVWELNRHQFMLDLGRAWVLNADAHAAHDAQHLVRHWQVANPYGMGINWAGPLEVAYRALSWAWAYGMTLDAPDRDESIWLAGFYDHGRYLYRHLELFSSPYNHLIGEAAVLFMLGLWFPELDEAAKWRRRGRRILEQRLSAQFYGDGGSVEQATVYHHATLGFYILAAVAARRTGEDLSPAVWGAIERAIEWGMRMQQPDGTLPAIGDNDDARPILFEWRPTWDFRHHQAIGAVLFNRADFKAAAGRFHEEALWLLGPAAAESFDSMPTGPLPVNDRLSESGYVILRSGRETDADYLCFDCGEQAGGLRHDAVPSAAHGHADCLSVVLWLGGRPVLTDAGYLTYNGDEAQERFYRETMAHNTVRVDREEQAVHLVKMAWTHAPRARVHHVDLATASAVASHDGYARLRPPVHHTRSVWLKPGCLVVLDHLEGLGSHHAELNWHFSPDLEASWNGGTIRASDRFSLAWAATVDLQCELVRGGPEPESGWAAPHLGVRVPASRVALQGEFSHSCSVLSIVADTARWKVARASHEGGTLLAQLDDGHHVERLRLDVPGRRTDLTTLEL